LRIFNLAQLSVAEIALLPRGIKNSIVVVIFIGTLCFGFLLILDPLWQQMQNLSKKHSALNSKLKLLQHQAAVLPQLKKQVLVLEEDYASYIRQDKVDFSFTDVLQDVARTAAAEKFDLNNIHPEMPQTVAGEKEYPLSFTAILNYRQLLAFCKLMLKFDYPVLIDELSMQKTNNAEELFLQAKIVAYQNAEPLLTGNNDNIADGWQKKIEQKRLLRHRLKLSIVRDPFVAASNAAICDLAQWASNELKFLGIFQQGDATFGIVEDPLGNVYHVTYGMRIGAGHSKILQINEQGIITEHGADNIPNAVEL
jgi:Tfp pilus assembly protein PilO